MQNWKLYNSIMAPSSIQYQGARSKNQEKLRKVCAEFESLFIHYMLKTMRNSSLKSQLLHSKYEDIYNSIIDQQISLHISKAGGIGIGEILYNQLKVLDAHDDKK